jgi:hypothetical protein
MSRSVAHVSGHDGQTGYRNRGVLRREGGQHEYLVSIQTDSTTGRRRVSACEDELRLRLGLSWLRNPLKWTDVVSRPESSDERMFWLAQGFCRERVESQTF